MLRHVLRIFRSDLPNWLPAIVVVALVTALIGPCVNQFLWTGTDAFVTAALRAGIDPAAFSVVSVTIYVFIAVLALFTLTVVGSATVERVRDTFARWRLVGATPGQVRRALAALVLVAAVAGALPGSMLSIGISCAAIPVFNQMVAQSVGTAAAGTVSDQGMPGFVAPPFHPSAAVWGLTLALGVLTCAGGALAPALRAGRVEPVEAIVAIGTGAPRRRWASRTLGCLLVLMAAGIAVSAALGQGAGEVGTRSAGMVNAAILAGMIGAVAGQLFGPDLIAWQLSWGRRLWQRIGRGSLAALAARSARTTLERNAHLITPLAVALGLAGVTFTTLLSYLAVMEEAGSPVVDPNFTDIVVMIALLGFMSLLTSIAVMALSGRDIGRSQAILRTAGMAPSQVVALIRWQSLHLTGCVAVLAAGPTLLAAVVVAACSTGIVGRPIVRLGWSGPILTLLGCWIVLFGVQWLQATPWLRREVVAGLRQD